MEDPRIRAVRRSLTLMWLIAAALGAIVIWLGIELDEHQRALAASGVLLAGYSFIAMRRVRRRADIWMLAIVLWSCTVGWWLPWWADQIEQAVSTWLGPDLGMPEYWIEHAAGPMVAFSTSVATTFLLYLATDSARMLVLGTIVSIGATLSPLTPEMPVASMYAWVAVWHACVYSAMCRWAVDQTKARYGNRCVRCGCQLPTDSVSRCGACAARTQRRDGLHLIASPGGSNRPNVA